LSRTFFYFINPEENAVPEYANMISQV